VDERRPAGRVLAGLTLVALALITADYRQGQQGPVTAVQRGASQLVAPLQQGVAGLTRPIADAATALSRLSDRDSRIATLEAENARLRSRLRSRAGLARRVETLEGLLRLRRRLPGSQAVAARVVARPPGVAGKAVTVDAGTRQGLAQGMPVVAPNGLVGKVAGASRTHAQVELLTAPRARYVVRVAATGETGLVTGRGGDGLTLRLTDPDAGVEAGATLVTHAFAGSSIPDGLPLGTVTGGVSSGAVGRAPVSPAVDLSRLAAVQVAVTAPHHPEPDSPATQPAARPGSAAHGRPATGSDRS
jgi:rod shape-determining protein MreC